MQPLRKSCLIILLPISPDMTEILSPMGQMAERGDTKVVEHLHEKTKLVKIILKNN